MIYAVQINGRHDLGSAMHYASEIRSIFQRGVFPDNAEERIVAMRRAVARKLETFNPDKDYILLGGCPAAIALVAGHVIRYHGRGTFLKWDNDNRGYYPVTIDLIGESNGNEKENHKKGSKED